MRNNYASALNLNTKGAHLGGPRKRMHRYHTLLFQELVSTQESEACLACRVTPEFQEILQSSNHAQILLKCMCGNTRAPAASVVKHHLGRHRRRAGQVFPQCQEFQKRRLGLGDRELLGFQAHQACRHLGPLQN